MFSSVLVANRGEIAVRIGATLRRLGVRGVAIHTADDMLSPHVTAMSGSVLVPSYLDVDAVVGAAVSSGCDALHPGYGFLSENPALARACAAARIAFVGPPADAIRLMGDKINAKRAVAAAGVPVVPGRDEAGLDDEELARAALDVGLPVLLKPSAGGGGKGMRRVDDPSQLAAAIAAARREAVAAFGDGTLLVERYVDRPRHIEMQVFADSHGRTVALGERECSLQRRHQKIVEEAPSALLDDEVRRRMAAAAVAAAESCGYIGAGTVEFIVSADRPDEFFFMEMNTRLQVEHPVTEMVLGIDLVEWQLRVASGEPLPCDPARPPRSSGHAVEARIYAEDPARDFLPSSGRVLALQEPLSAEGIRVDSALGSGVEVGTRFDPMVAKVVAHGSDRASALSLLRRALGEYSVLGFTTNTGFLRRLLAEPDVVAGNLDTGLVERVAPALALAPVSQWALVTAALLSRHLSIRGGGPWDRCDGWRVSGAIGHRCSFAGQPPVFVFDGGVRIGVEPVMAARVVGVPSVSHVATEIEGVVASWTWALELSGAIWVGRTGDSWRFAPAPESTSGGGAAVNGGGRVASPMPGRVLAVHASPGSNVREGAPLVTVEAMKMEHVVVAPYDGTVDSVLVRVGDPVVLDQELAVVAPTAPERGDQSSIAG